METLFRYIAGSQYFAFVFGGVGGGGVLTLTPPLFPPVHGWVGLRVLGPLPLPFLLAETPGHLGSPLLDAGGGGGDVVNAK